MANSAKQGNQMVEVEEYKEGDFIDAKDNQSDWRVAEIVYKNQHNQIFKVRFDGWQSKYDEVIKFNSPKLKPFRSIVIGYTGQQQNPAIREWKFQPKQHQQRILRMQLLFKQPEGYSVHEINQLLRGHIYLYTDFLMINKYQNVSDITLAIEYYYQNIQFLVEFLSNIAAHFQEFLQTISNNREMGEMSSKEALYKSYYEVFDTAYIISGNYSRLNGFFKDNSELIKEFYGNTKKEAKKIYQMTIIRKFVGLKGLDLIGQIINKLNSHQELIPFLFLNSLANLYFALSCMITNEDREPNIQKMMEIGEKNIKKLKDHHFKDLHRTHVINYLSSMVDLSAGTRFQQNMQEWSAQLQLEFSLKMIECPYFENKLKGISLIIKTCEKNESILTNNRLKDWMREIKLMEILFVNNDNQEFIKKACEFIKFLNIKQMIGQEDVDLIWKSRVGKHETIVKQIYNLIGEFPLYQSQTYNKLRLFHMIKLDKESWDEDYVKMIKEFTENAYGMNIRQKLTELYGLNIVYQYCLINPTDISLNYLNTLLHRTEKSKVHQKFQEGCFTSISKEEFSWIHIRILSGMCSSKTQSFDKLEVEMVGIVSDFLLRHAMDQNAKLITDGFTLLQEVILNAHRELSNQQLMALWNKFIHSKNRALLMRWLYKKKQNGKVTISLCLNETNKNYLLKFLWNSEESIKNIDIQEVTFIIELIKNVNVLNQKIKRFNLILRPISFELDGYSKIWKILKYAQKKEVIDSTYDFIAEIHCSYEEENLEISIQKIVENIVLEIQKSLKYQNMGHLASLLNLTKQLILKDQQIYNYNYDYSQKPHNIKEYHVVNKQNSEEKALKFNYFYYFYDFKRLVSEKFNISMPNLHVLFKGQEVKYQSYFKTMAESQFAGCKFQIVQQGRESIIKNELNNKLDLFFSLLDVKIVQQSVWTIVQKLPISEELKFKILEKENILDDLKSVGFYKQLYELKVMLQLEAQWWIKFISNYNMQILISNLSRIKYSSNIQLDYLSTVTEIIMKMLNIYEEESIILDIPETLFQNIMLILFNLLQHITLEGTIQLGMELKILKNLFGIIKSLQICDSYDINKRILNNKYISSILQQGLISMPILHIRKRLFEEFKRFFIELADEKNWLRLIHLLVIQLLNIIVDQQLRDNPKEYFQLTSTILDKVPQKYLFKFMNAEGKAISNKLFKLVMVQSAESSHESFNLVLIGYLSLLKHLSPYQSQEFQVKIAKFIIFQCLFSQGEAKCKSKRSRLQALYLLKNLFVNPSIIHFVLGYLSELHKGGKWRSKRFDDWTITISDKMKSNTGYVGLKNLGCICYMNSFMQQLFMIPSFRKSVINTVQAGQPVEQDENLVFQIQKMFLNLMLSNKKFYNPKDLCNAFKDYDGNPTNVGQQMDIDQFSNILFDRLEGFLKGSDQETLIKDMFGGVFSNEIVSKGCEHFSQREENFLSISLTVKSKKNIYQSFETMIKGDTLQGDNAYFCERCNKKVTAVKRVSLKKLPNYLIITLKRFEYDYEKMMKLKVNDYYEFPHELNLKEYSRQHLRKLQSKKNNQDEEIEESNEYYDYALKGVVVHSGYADNGHYYSFIQDRSTKKWFQFNDSLVRDFNVQDLSEQAFGGQYGRIDTKQKIKNAYMLIYQRKSKAGPLNEACNEKEQTIKDFHNKRVIEEMAVENQEQKIHNILFSNQYSRFVNYILQNVQNYDEKMQPKVIKFAVTAYLTIAIREKSDSEIYNKLKRINAKISAYPEISEWIVQLFSQAAFFDQFFKNNIIRQVKRILSQWLVFLYKSCEREVQDYFCNMLLNKLVQQNQNILEYCLILYSIAKENKQSLDYLVSRNVIGRLMQNLSRKEQRIFSDKLQMVEIERSQMGNELIVQKSRNEQKIKMLKLDNENGYVWGLFNLVINRSAQLKIPLPEYLLKVQCSYLKMSEVKLFKSLQETKNKFQLYHMTTFIAFLTQNDKDFLVKINELLYRGLKEFQSKRYRQFFLLFQKLIHIQDGLTDTRLSGFDKILQALKFNEEYTLDSNIIQQWIVIILNRNQNLRTYLCSKPDELSYLLTLATKKNPSEEVTRKNITYLQFMINKYHGVKFPKHKKGYIKISQKMAEFYEQMKLAKFNHSTEWPSAREIEQKELQVGQTVGFFESKENIQYQQAKIESIFLNRIQLCLKKNGSLFVWKNDQKISYNIELIGKQEQNDVNSSRTTEMEFDSDDIIDQL